VEKPKIDIQIIQPSVQILTPEAWLLEYPRLLEIIGRTCYKSENHITDQSAEKFVQMLIRNGHESVLEHLAVTVRFVGDRSMSHQLVRHRIAAYSQESQRYVNYSQKGFQVIRPLSIEMGTPNFQRWLSLVEEACARYSGLIEAGIKPEDARSVLPNATKTEVVTTYNLRQWRHVFKERALNPRAQWQIRGLMRMALDKLFTAIPTVFEDLYTIMVGPLTKPKIW